MRTKMIRSKKYAKDEEGYVLISFVKKNTQKKVKKVNLDAFFSDKALIKLADEGKLTQKFLLDMDFTQMLRFATYKPAGDYIMEKLGLRGFYLREKLPDGKPLALLPHQIKSLTWARERESLEPKDNRGLRGGILRLKQGLGKTLTALTLILTSPKGEFPSLVVCSLTLMREWKQQIANFFGETVKVLYYHKEFIPKKKYDVFQRKDLLGYEIVITTYDVIICKETKVYREQTYEIGDEHTLMKDKKVAIHHRSREQANKPNVKGPGILFCTPWERVICDESQKFANPDTVVYEAVMGLYGEKMWCLTGTPIRNTELDIWAQLRFCGYTGVTLTMEWKRTGYAQFKNHELGKAIMSMDYKDANITLPMKTEYICHVELSGNHKIFYDWMMGQMIDTYDELMKGACSFASVLAMFTRLRQCTIAPYLTTFMAKRQKLSKKEELAEKEAIAKIKKRFEGSEMFKWLIDKNTDSGINSSKIKRIIDILSKIPGKEKVLIFSMFTSCTDLLADAIKVHLPDFDFVQVDGDVKGNERNSLLDKFRKDPGVRGLLMTYKVGSEGLNLVEATHCICIEPWWTNAVHDQAKARCWRMGQTKEVFMHNVFVQNTIEEKVAEICHGKDQIAASFLEGTEQPLGKNQGLNKATLGRILGIK